MLSAIQYLILGTIQGITEWLPISSSAMITLISTIFFSVENVEFLIQSALILHIGTLISAIIYFRRDIVKLTKTFFRYKYQDDKSKKTLKFLIISTAISGFLGILILEGIASISNSVDITGKVITLIVSGLLMVTGFSQLKIKSKGLRRERDLRDSDGVLLGIAQGISSLPGISRSGITVSALLLRKIDDAVALKLSFLMSIPIVLLGNIFINLKDFSQVFTLNSLVGIAVAFFIGLLTISGLIKISKKINFGWFLVIFALLMIFSALI